MISIQNFPQRQNMNPYRKYALNAYVKRDINQSESQSSVKWTRYFVKQLEPITILPIQLLFHSGLLIISLKNNPGKNSVWRKKYISYQSLR